MIGFLPHNWPNTIPYAPFSYAHSISIENLRLLLFPPRAKSYSSLIKEGKVHRDIEIRILKKPHLLGDKRTTLGHYNRGVFAVKAIPKGTILGEYVGLIEVDEIDQEVLPSCKKLEYSWVISHPHFKLSINAESGANELAFVNDYRNISLLPNIEPVFFPHGEYHYFCYKTSRKIFPNEELLIDYHEAFWN